MRFIWTLTFIIGLLLAVHCKDPNGSVLTKLISKAKLTIRWNAFKDFGHRMVDRVKEKLRCTQCKITTGTVHKLIQAGAKDSTIASVLIGTCQRLRIQNKKFCSSIIHQNIDTLMYILRKKKIGSKAICGTILESYKCGGGPIVKWDIPLDMYGSKPEKEIPRSPKSVKKIEKILHVSDIHYDSRYQVGEKSNCGEPLCCRKGQGKGTKGHAAGKYGSYENCDLPLSTLKSSLEQMASHKDVKYIYVTGDFVPHNVHDVSKEQVQKDITDVTTLINEYFPKIPIFYSIGNHDSEPVNQFPPSCLKGSKYDNQWLYDLVVEQWGKSLTHDAKVTFRKSGFYTVLLDSGLRIISLNSQFCYCLNWWLMYDSKDPHGQLRWLADTLYYAEKHNQPCHILTHIPVGHIDCLYIYSRELWRILTRFSNTIKGIFHGHTHYHQFNILYDYKTNEIPLIPMMNAGSLTPFAFVNPNYNIYDFDSQTWSLLDAQCWIFDLNQNNVPPRWFSLYSFRTSYEIESMDPTDLDKIIIKMIKDKKWMDKYNLFYAKGARTSVVTKCKDHCKKERLREIVTGNYLDNRKWKKIRRKIKW